MEDFDRRGYEDSERTVQRALEELTEEGRGDNDQQCTPKGYGVVRGEGA
jgi:hypothetical protein